MKLGYKHPTGNSPAYWFGKIDGDDFKFVRAVVGLSTPTLDRAMGAAVLFGELYRPSGAQGFRAIDAHVGDWPFIENWLVVQRKQTQFGYLITEPGTDPTDLYYQMHQLAYALDELPLIPLEAPKHAMTEFARQKIDQMIDDGRLDLSPVLRKLGYQQEDSQAAIQSAVIWMDENKPRYAGRNSRPVKYKHLMGQI